MSDNDKLNAFLNDLVQHFCEMQEKLQRIYSEDPPAGMAPHFGRAAARAGGHPDHRYPS